MAFFEKAIQKYADYYEAYYHLGVAQTLLGQNDRALELFQSSINLSGGSYALPEFAYALLLCKIGKPAEAELIVRNGLELRQHIPFGKIVLGTVLVKLNRFDQAERNARDALSEDSTAADAYLVLASVDDSRGNYAQERRDLDAFLGTEPNGSRREQIQAIRDAVERLVEHSAVGHQNRVR